MRGLKNELKAADRFLGTESEGGARVRPKLAVHDDAEEEDNAWRDLWELFEEVRWLCTRPETWPTKFGAGMKELLPPRERLALAGEWDAGTIFVSSDATKVKIAAIDWTNGVALRMSAASAAAWVQRCQEGMRLPSMWRRCCPSWRSLAIWGLDGEAEWCCTGVTTR